MARDYLAIPASSAAVERSFSAAADVCSATRGRLASETIERNVGSLLWLGEKVELLGEWMVVASVLAKNAAKSIIQ